MTALDHRSLSIHAARPLGWLVLVASIFGEAVVVMRNRKALRQLGELTDYELHDIGLMRSDLRDACELPLRTRPTSRLAQLAAHRAAEQALRRMK